MLVPPITVTNAASSAINAPKLSRVLEKISWPSRPLANRYAITVAVAVDVASLSRSLIAAWKTPFQPTATNPESKNTKGAAVGVSSNKLISRPVVSPIMANVFSLDSRLSAIRPQNILPTSPSALPMDNARNPKVEEI